MQVQRLNALLSLEPLAKTERPEAQTQQGQSFSEVLNQALSKVEQTQAEATEVATKLATGEITDITQVMIASERANLTLSLTLQVRNKLLEAYQDLMRTPL